MFAIELYRKYLHNSTIGISNTEKAKKLAFEKQKISDILEDLPNLFYMDKAVMNKGDTTVYTYIKREILSEILRRGQESVISESNFFLHSVLSEIESMREAVAA